MKLRTLLWMCAASVLFGACTKDQETPQPGLKVICHSGIPSLGLGERDRLNRFVWNISSAYMLMEIDARSLPANQTVSLSFEALAGTFSED